MGFASERGPEEAQRNFDSGGGYSGAGLGPEPATVNQGRLPDVLAGLLLVLALGAQEGEGRLGRGPR